MCAHGAAYSAQLQAGEARQAACLPGLAGLPAASSLVPREHELKTIAPFSHKHAKEDQKK